MQKALRSAGAFEDRCGLGSYKRTAYFLKTLQRIPAEAGTRGGWRVPIGILEQDLTAAGRGAHSQAILEWRLWWLEGAEHLELRHVGPLIVRSSPTGREETVPEAGDPYSRVWTLLLATLLMWPCPLRCLLLSRGWTRSGFQA